MARTEAAQCIDFLLQRESTVENEAAATDKPEHLVRLLFIYPQLKFVRLHASSSHNIFAYLSPARLDLAQHSPEFELKHDLKKPSGKIPLIALLSIPGIIAGAFGTLSIS
jgi:hypothetical protein